MNSTSSGPNRLFSGPNCCIRSYCLRLPCRFYSSWTCGVNVISANWCAMMPPVPAYAVGNPRRYRLFHSPHLAAERLADQSGDLGAMGFEREVARVQEVDFRARQVTFI